MADPCQRESYLSELDRKSDKFMNVSDSDGTLFIGNAIAIVVMTNSPLTYVSSSAENLPQSKQYLLTMLSVFFSIGAVLASLIGVVMLPGKSCDFGDPETCDIAGGENSGWRRMIYVIAFLVSSLRIEVRRRGSANTVTFSGLCHVCGPIATLSTP